MFRYIFQRLGYMFLTFFAIMVLTFFFMRLLPGTPFGNESKLTPNQVQALKQHYQMDDPLVKQFGRYVWHFIHGDLGESFQYGGQRVTDILFHRLGVSVLLGGEALLFGFFVGLALGILAALKHRTFLDHSLMVIAVVGVSIPGFIFAGILQYFVGVKWGWLPVAYWGRFSYSIMPALSLSVVVIAVIARFIRSEMLEVLGKDYVVLARVKGLSTWEVVFKHCIRNALIPVLTVIGPLVASLMTGALVIEQIFSIPGLGQQFVLAVTTRDYPMIMGVTLLYAAVFIVTVFIVDILYGVIDPRIRFLGGQEL